MFYFLLKCITPCMRTFWHKVTCIWWLGILAHFQASLGSWCGSSLIHLCLSYQTACLTLSHSMKHSTRLLHRRRQTQWVNDTITRKADNLYTAFVISLYVNIITMCFVWRIKLWVPAASPLFQDGTGSRKAHVTHYSNTGVAIQQRRIKSCLKHNDLAKAKEWAN